MLAITRVSSALCLNHMSESPFHFHTARSHNFGQHPFDINKRRKKKSNMGKGKHKKETRKNIVKGTGNRKDAPRAVKELATNMKEKVSKKPRDPPTERPPPKRPAEPKKRKTAGVAKVARKKKKAHDARFNEPVPSER